MNMKLAGTGGWVAETIFQDRNSEAQDVKLPDYQGCRSLGAQSLTSVLQFINIHELC